MRGNVGTLLAAVLFAAVNTNAQSGLITAASCNAGHVQAALNAATDGDTVAIPAGTCAWTTQVSWDAPANVILRGAGDSSLGGGDRTVIVDNYASDTTLLKITTNAVGTFRMTGLTIQGGTGTLKNNRMVLIGGLSKQFRLDHVHINGMTYSPGHNASAIRIGGWINGVIDHSLFETYQGPDIWFSAYGGVSNGDGAWAAPAAFGSSDFIFIEDSKFNWHSGVGRANDCSNGGKFVFRHNTLSKGVQTHPTGGLGRLRGCRAFEVYNNTFEHGFTSVYDMVWMSSGTALIWGNTSAGGFDNFVTVHSMRRDDGTYSQTAAPAGWGYCGTSFNGTGSNWDGNTSASTGYPCLDQPGRGMGQLLAGSFPNVVNTVRGTIAWPNQALEPLYEWGNMITLRSGGAYWPTSSANFAAERDYYRHTASFNGTSGVGTGSFASRPSTCTAGVAYWASDQETLYKCTATNTWTMYYKPYTYPHPLTQGTPSLSAPAAPRNLRIVP